MCFVRVRPVTISLMAGGMLFSAATGFTVAAAAPDTPVAAPASTQADGAFLTALTTQAGPAYPATSLQCKPLSLPAGSTSPPSAPGSATTPPPGTGATTPPPTGTGTPTPTDTGSPTPTDTGSPSPTGTGAPTPTDTGSPTPTDTQGSPTSSATPSAPASSPGTTGTPSPAPDSGNLASAGTAVTSASLTAFRSAARYAAGVATPQMCVGVERAQGSIKHGQAAQWVVSAYATGAGTTNVSVGVSAAPAGQRASFDFGCSKQNGTAACELGTVNPGTPVHQVQAQIAVPATSRVTAVRLTATVSADHLPARPQASVAVVVAAGAGAPNPVDYLTDPALRNASYLPILSAGLSEARTTLSPGGNAASLFPELVPGTGSGSGPSNGTGSRARNAVALASSDLPVFGAQVTGLAALALALLLAAVPRLRVRVLEMVRETARLVRYTH